MLLAMPSCKPPIPDQRLDNNPLPADAADCAGAIKASTAALQHPGPDALPEAEPGLPEVGQHVLALDFAVGLVVLSEWP